MSAEMRDCVLAIMDRPGLELPREVPGVVSKQLVPDDPANWDGLDYSEVNFFLTGPWWPSDKWAALFERMPKLEVVQSLNAGVERLAPVIPDGVIFCNASGVHDVATAEWCVAMMLSLTRGFPELRDAQHEHRWQSGPGKKLVSDRELFGSTVLILGYGAIGSAVEQRLTAFGVDFIRVARSAREGVHGVDELAELLPQADVVLVTMPFTAETAGMIDAEFLARMHDGAVFINAARGGVADTDAIVAEAASGRLRVGLDVISPTPLPPEHPAWDTPNLFLTPHIAGITPSFLPRVLLYAADQIERWVRGEPMLNRVENGY
jgi:phosphoglycerate dehydrogenase-like enzyme